MIRNLVPVLALSLLASPLRAELPAPLTCLLWPDRSSEIGADVNAIVAQVAVRRADRVAKGDLLLQLDDRIAQAELDKARILAQVSGDKLARAEGVTAGRVISIEEMANLRGEAAMAAADLLRAELMLERLRILAPFDGVVAEVMTETGQLINAQPLLRLIDIRNLRAEVVFAAEAFGQLHEGDTLTLRVELGGSPDGAEVEGHIVTVDSYISPVSNSFTVIAQIDNAAGNILAGTSCALVEQAD